MKKLLSILVLFVALLALVGCSSADVIQNNIGKEADNFNAYRKVTVINLRSDKILMEVEG